MADLDARPVDPREHRWEVWEVSARDVAEVIEWADLNAKAGEAYMLFAVVDRGNNTGLVRLAGHDPTRNEGP